MKSESYKVIKFCGHKVCKKKSFHKNIFTKYVYFVVSGPNARALSLNKFTCCILQIRNEISIHKTSLSIYFRICRYNFDQDSDPADLLALVSDTHQEVV